MATPRIDPTFQPARFVFGYSLPGSAYFGNNMTYPQNAIFGQGAFSEQLAGWHTEAEKFRFIYGAPVPRATGPWPCTPDMSIFSEGVWAKRVTFYRWRGKQRVKSYTPDASAAKESIVPTMLKLMEATFIWHLFDDATKRQLDSDASRLGLRYTGYNYFTKLYIQDNPRWQSYV